MAALFGDTGAYRKNLIWSNLYKISAPGGNPTTSMIRAQQELAIRTVREEIREYRPTLVVFASAYMNRLYDAAVYEIVGSQYKDDWQVQDEGQPSESWALRRPNEPALLWTRHPGRKTNEVIDRWLQRADEICVERPTVTCAQT